MLKDWNEEGYEVLGSLYDHNNDESLTGDQTTIFTIPRFIPPAIRTYDNLSTTYPPSVSAVHRNEGSRGAWTSRRCRKILLRVCCIRQIIHSSVCAGGRISSSFAGWMFWWNPKRQAGKALERVMGRSLSPVFLRVPERYLRYALYLFMKELLA